MLEASHDGAATCEWPVRVCDDRTEREIDSLTHRLLRLRDLVDPALLHQPAHDEERTVLQRELDDGLRFLVTHSEHSAVPETE